MHGFSPFWRIKGGKKDKLHITLYILPFGWSPLFSVFMFLHFVHSSVLLSISNHSPVPMFTLHQRHPQLLLEYRHSHCSACFHHLYWLYDILWQVWVFVIYLLLRLERLNGSSAEKWMRNNNIIIVKCFISSFAGKRIHQSFRGGWVEAGEDVGTWHEGAAQRFGGCYCLYVTADDWR